MRREKVIRELKAYFRIEELVSKQVFDTYKDDAWALFQTDTLHCLLIMRKGINKPFSVNNWLWGGEYSQRGFRENLSEIVLNKTLKNKLYTSGHVLGCAIDFVVSGMDAEDVRNWIVEHADLFPCKVRLEHKLNGSPITWVHFDTKHYERHPKIYLFNM